MRVFVSSTVYDLIDVRSEIAEQLNQLGVTPVLSDDKLSDFKVLPDRNSIETCLVNVESCDEFILILDQRYGSSLKDCGYDDLSATHLEYKRALDTNKPIRIYVRDRLVADYSIWKKNGRNSNLNFLWVSEEKDHKLFNFLDECSKLKADSTNSNWYFTFTDSVDFKTAITKHFEKRILPKRVIEAIQANIFPLLNVDVETKKQPDGSFIITAIIANISQAPAFNFSCYWEDEIKNVAKRDIYLSGQLFPMGDIWQPVCPFNRSLIIHYKSSLGISIEEKYCVNVQVFKSPPSISKIVTPIYRNLRRSTPISIEIED